MQRLKAEEATLAQEQEETHGEFMKNWKQSMKKGLYIRFQSEDDKMI